MTEQPKTQRRPRRTKDQIEAASREAQAKEAEQVPINAVLVLRVEDDEGNLQVDVQTLGNVRVTEVETCLKLALKVIQGRLGVE